MQSPQEDIETEKKLKAKENQFDQWEGLDSDLLVLDGITTVLTIVTDYEWTPSIVSSLSQYGYEIIFSNFSYTIYRIPLQEFGDKEELMLRRELMTQHREIVDFEAIQPVLYGEYPYNGRK
jgi:hypothetical protein